MLARLGNVLFWIGVIIAAGWLFIGYSEYSTGHHFESADFATLAIVPAISLSVGWALRYILRG
jgi:hypothetical protein